MYTLELGYLNAGFIFFALALASTLVLGRFFCGWGCHVVALQDLCGWLMKRVGIRPRPFRSRLLLLAPLILALYMFVWPSFARVLLGNGAPFPGLSNHLVTENFWATFPGPVFTVLTFVVCGFAAVYFLGAKGFCSYGCPYGAFFVIADRFSPGRIRVTDACEQCGHCTATCTSNVRVHEEVRDYGKVVDPGCMKCMDCVNVCPKGALYFGFAMPAAFSRNRAPYTVANARPALSLGEELLVGGVALGATLAFRGLYDGPPLLMSVGLGGITAFVALKLWHLVRRPTVRVQNLVLKLQGRWRKQGVVFSLLGGIWLGFTAQSGFVQWHRKWGAYYRDQTQVGLPEVLSGAWRTRTLPESHHAAQAQSTWHFEIADRFGLFPVVEVKLGRAWAELLSNDWASAITYVHEAIAVAPDHRGLHEHLVQLLAASGSAAEAAEVLAAMPGFGSGASARADRCRLGALRADGGQLKEAVDSYRLCVADGQGSAQDHYNLGGILRRLDRVNEAIPELQIAARIEPSDPDVRVELGLALVAAERREEGVTELKRAASLAPDRTETRIHLLPLIAELERGGSGN